MMTIKSSLSSRVYNASLIILWIIRCITKNHLLTCYIQPLSRMGPSTVYLLVHSCVFCIIRTQVLLALQNPFTPLNYYWRIMREELIQFGVVGSSLSRLGGGFLLQCGHKMQACWEDHEKITEWVHLRYKWKWTEWLFKEIIIKLATMHW